MPNYKFTTKMQVYIKLYKKLQATTSKRINKKSTLFATILQTIMIENNMALRDPSYTPKRLPPPPPET